MSTGTDRQPATHTVTASPRRHPAHADRPRVAGTVALAALVAAALIAAVAGMLLVRAGSVPSAPESARRITAPPRPAATAPSSSSVGRT